MLPPSVISSFDWIKVLHKGVGRIDPGGTVEMGEQVRLYSRVSDLETPSSGLTVSISYRPQEGSWTTEAATYQASKNYWYYDWTIPGDAETGLYDVKVDVEDPHGGTASSTELGEYKIT